MTHWRELRDQKYLGSWDLNGDLTLKIVSVSKEKVKNAEGESSLPILHFDGYKPLLLNVTNATTISKLYDTDEVEKWVGKSITIYSTKVKVGKNTTDGIRIRPIIPNPTKETLTPTHPKWKTVTEQLSNGKSTMDTVLKYFEVSDADFKTLEKLLPNA